MTDTFGWEGSQHTAMLKAAYVVSKIKLKSAMCKASTYLPSITPAPKYFLESHNVCIHTNTSCKIWNKIFDGYTLKYG